MSRISPDSSWFLDDFAPGADEVDAHDPCHGSPGRPIHVPGVNPNGGPVTVSDRSHKIMPPFAPPQKPNTPPNSIASLVAAQGDHLRLRTMSPRNRSATLGERPNNNQGVDISPKPFENMNSSLAGSKRMSRDDFHIPVRRTGPTTLSNKRMSRDDSYIPVRLAGGARLQSNQSGSRSRPFPSELSPLSRSPWNAPQHLKAQTMTPEPIPERESQGDIVIGMALGSPRHASPTQPSIREDRPHMTRAMTVPAESAVSSSLDDGLTRSKSRKWGIFGRSKSKRGKPLDHNAPKPGSTEPVSNASHGGHQQKQANAHLVRKDADPARQLKHKPIVVRSQTDPTSTLLDRHEQKHRLPQKPTTPASADDFSNKPLLDVKIPSIELERYSIMFGSVLQPHQQQAAQPASSLLSRRQATLNRLQAIEDRAKSQVNTQSSSDDRLGDLPLPRRATSPQPRNSPTFSLFPGAIKVDTTPVRQSPRARSNTSPAFLPSPSQEDFTLAKSHSDSPHKSESLMAIPRNVVPDTGTITQRRTQVQPARGNDVKQTPIFVNRKSRAYLSPAMEADEDVKSHISDKLIPSLPEPTWQMLNPAIASQGSPKSAQAPLSAPTAGTPKAIAAPSPPATVNQVVEEDPAEQALRDAVQSSIARQISLSQQQRALLQSLDSKGSRGKDASPKGVGIARAGLPKIVIGKNERLAETKSSTPTLVHPPGHSVLSPPRGMHMHRKSERVILEAV